MDEPRRRAPAGVPHGADRGLPSSRSASVFALIPSGPGYAGTPEPAASSWHRGARRDGPPAVATSPVLRFVIVVPITLSASPWSAGRYGGLGRLPPPPALASCARAATSSPAPRRPARAAPGGRGEIIVYPSSSPAALAVRATALGDYRHLPPRRETGRLLTLCSLDAAGYRCRPRSCTGPLHHFYLTALTSLSRVQRSNDGARLARADEPVMVPLALLRRLGPRRAFHLCRITLAFRPVVPLLQPLRARGHLRRPASRARARRRRHGFLRNAASELPAYVTARAQLRRRARTTSASPSSSSALFLAPRSAPALATVPYPSTSLGAVRRPVGARSPSFSPELFTRAVHQSFFARPPALDGLRDGIAYSAQRRPVGGASAPCVLCIILLFAEESPAARRSRAPPRVHCGGPRLLRLFLSPGLRHLARAPGISWSPGRALLPRSSASRCLPSAPAGRPRGVQRSRRAPPPARRVGLAVAVAQEFVYLGHGPFWANCRVRRRPREFPRLRPSSASVHRQGRARRGRGQALARRRYREAPRRRVIIPQRRRRSFRRGRRYSATCRCLL